MLLLQWRVRAVLTKISTTGVEKDGGDGDVKFRQHVQQFSGALIGRETMLKHGPIIINNHFLLLQSPDQLPVSVKMRVQDTCHGGYEARKSRSTCQTDAT